MSNDLVVQLGAKLDQFQSDMNKAGDIADDAVSRIEQSFASLNPTAGGFASLGVAAAGVTGLVGGLLTAITKVNSELADLQKNAEFTGLTAERFQQIQFAAGQGGVSSKESAEDLRKVASLLADAKENENSLTRLLDANNIKYKDRNGHVISLNQLLTIAGGLINKFDSIPEKSKAAQMLGLSEGWVEALRNGSKAFEEIARGAEAAGVIIDGATVAKAAAFDRAWNQSTATLAAQFKAVSADIAGYLDGLIDKAKDLLAKVLESQNIQSGSGQDKFNAWADSISVAIKEALGLKQNIEQLGSVIDRMSEKGEDPAIIRGLELTRAKAELAAKMLQAVAEQQSKADFPNGVPTPRARPAAANNPSPDAAHLPKRKDGEEAADAYDRARETLTKYVATTNALAKAQGEGAAATEQAKAQAQLLAAAQQAGIPITQKVMDQIQDLSQDAGLAAEALEKARVATNISRGQQTSLLSPEDVQIANILQKVYPSVDDALKANDAAPMKTSAAMRRSTQVAEGQRQ
ncbi:MULTISPECIES: hypothetical protein [unclassified Bradyrhizobium]